MKLISIVTPCFNEEENIHELYNEIKQIMGSMQGYSYEHIFADNASTDKTIEILRELAQLDKNVKVILNTRNFGAVRSAYHGLLRAKGDAAIMIVADFQDPPSVINEFIQKWEAGYKIVVGVKDKSEELKVVFRLRSFYYRLLAKFSDVDLIEHFTGFGLYDKQVIQTMRKLNDPNPYFRGLVAELGYEYEVVKYSQPIRLRGHSKVKWFTLYDIGMHGLTSYSKLPLRFAAIIGSIFALISFCIGIFYLIVKLLNWESYSLGIASIAVGLFFFSSIQLVFLGILGEYIGSIYIQVLKRPHVIEKETLNFDN